MTTLLAPSPKFTATTATGAPLVLGKLYSYQAGTDIPLATYTSYSGGTENTNPVILDARGEANVWLGAESYKLVLKDATDALIWTVDNITGALALTNATITNALNSTSPGLQIEQYSTQIAAYGLDIHQYGENPSSPVPGDGASHAFVIHCYSDREGAMQIDNTRSKPLLTLKNAVNNVTSFGTIGSGSYLNIVGESVTTPNTIINLAELTSDLFFLSYDPLCQFKFNNGLIINAGPAETNRALVISALNAGYASTISGTDFGSAFITSANSGITLGVTKNGTGAGNCFVIQNKGTGDAISVIDASANVLFTVDKDGQVGIGSAPGVYGLAVTQANTTQAYFASTGANNANVAIDSNTAANQANLLFQDATVTKFTMGKTAANAWRLNCTAAGDVFGSTAAGDAILIPSGGTIPANSAASGTPGQIAWDATHFYVCVAANTWARATMASF